MKPDMKINSFAVGALATLTITLVGCNVDRVSPDWGAPRGPRTTVGDPSKMDSPIPTDINIVDQSEVDIVEEMIGNRNEYLASLEKLRDFYKSKGYGDKQAWADYELKGLRGLRTFRYLNDSEVPSGKLKPSAGIAEADALYEQGMKLMSKGGHGIPALYSEKTMVEAADTFRMLIEKYPSSDKIDDAAFQLGEIYKEYMKNQEAIAVKWYERCMEWDAETPHPVRFQAAVVYDYRLHDRDRALELYRQVIQREEGPLSNRVFSNRRIQELTSSQRSVQAAP